MPRPHRLVNHRLRRRWPAGSSTPRQRLAMLVAFAAVIGVLIGLLLPRVSPTIDKATGGYLAVGEAASALATLPVRADDAPDHASSYERDAFGFRTTDDDGDGCDVRDEVLERDLNDVVHKNRYSCVVQSGTLHDPYTGTDIEFMRGAGTSGAVQIDHVVSLSDAWRSGAHAWGTATRVRFANDPANLLAVDGAANQDKGDAAADFWLPPDETYVCAYVARQIGVKATYGLSVTAAEKDAMVKALAGCPGQSLPF